MSESVWVRRAGFAATVVGLVTAVIAVISWIATKSVRDALSIALPIAGAAFYLLALLGNFGYLVVAASKRQWEAVRAFGPVVILFLAIGAYFLVGGGTLRENLLEFGIIALLVTGFGVTVYVQARARAQRAAEQAAYEKQHQTCPDCAETIKAAATVCRYCGWRPAPSPIALGLYAAPGRDSTAALTPRGQDAPPRVVAP